MELLVKRFSDNTKATLGFLSIDKIPFCFTLEDEFRSVKMKKETRIPEGTYEIKFRKEGTHHIEYMKKYGVKHYGMLEITQVPNFQYILIHIGNFEKDTEGCLLVGEGSNSNHTITESTKAYERLYPIIAAALLKNEKVTITLQKV